MILLALALAAAPQPPAQPALNARDIVERQLAKTAPAPTGRLTAEEAAAIRERYLKSIGEKAQTGDEQSSASGGARTK
jgi:hypothetical protein